MTPPNPGYKHLVDCFSIPTFLVIGGTGAVISPLFAAELAGLNRCLEVVQIEDAGHGIPFDQPEQFSSVVKAFCGSFHAA